MTKFTKPDATWINEIKRFMTCPPTDLLHDDTNFATTFSADRQMRRGYYVSACCKNLCEMIPVAGQQHGKCSRWEFPKDFHMFHIESFKPLSARRQQGSGMPKLPRLGLALFYFGLDKMTKTLVLYVNWLFL